MAQVDLKNATIKILGGGSNEITVKIGEGNLTYTRKQNVEYTRDRGRLDTAKLGDEEPMDVSLDAVWENITGAGGVVTVEDAVTKQGLASGWNGTDPDTCAPYCVDILVEIAFPCTSGTSQDERILLGQFRWENFAHDLSAGTFAITGKCNNTAATATRT